MSARDDTGAYLQVCQRFVVEALENADAALIPLAQAWIANDRYAVWAILTGIVEDYAEHCIEDVFEQNPRMDSLDALHKLEGFYREKPAQNEVQPLFTDIFKRAGMTG